MIKDKTQTIPTYTDTLHVYSTVEGTSSLLLCCAHDARPGTLLGPVLRRGLAPPEPHPRWSAPELTPLGSPGYLAYRSEEKGSCFIQTLVKVLTEKKGSILELLTEVSWDRLPGPPTRAGSKQSRLRLSQTFLHFPPFLASLPCPPAPNPAWV